MGTSRSPRSGTLTVVGGLRSLEGCMCRTRRSRCLCLTHQRVVSFFSSPPWQVPPTVQSTVGLHAPGVDERVARRRRRRRYQPACSRPCGVLVVRLALSGIVRSQVFIQLLDPLLSTHQRGLSALRCCARLENSTTAPLCWVAQAWARASRHRARKLDHSRSSPAPAPLRYWPRHLPLGFRISHAALLRIACWSCINCDA